MYPQDRVPARVIVHSLKADASRIWLNADGDFRHEPSDAPIGTSKPARQRRGNTGSFDRSPDGFEMSFAVYSSLSVRLVR